MSAKKRFNFLEFALIFAIVYLLTQFALKTFFPDKYGAENVPQGIILSPVDATVKGGHHPLLTLKNKTEDDLVLADRCAKGLPPVDVFFVDNPEESDEVVRPLEPKEDVAIPCDALTNVPAGGKVQIDLASWKYSLFDEYGTYEVRLPIEGTEEDELTTRLSIHEAGTITKIFRTFITRPFLNFLIFIASLLPGYSLGAAIIILTIIVKLLLFFPTQHALEGQKRMQAVQPKLEEVKRKFKDDPQRFHQETMKIWKEYKVNPLQSCLPMLIQFPILIGLFFVIRDGSVLELSRHLIYEPYQDLPWTFGTNFLGLDLLKPNIYFMPPLLVALQFTQMKLSFAISKRKKEKEKVIDVGKKKEKKKEPASQQEMQQKMMLYGLPLLIGVFAIQFPAAVSLYWGISTVFAIGQQLVVNRKTLG